MSQPKILAFAGSTRTGSFNDRVLDIACTGARSAGAVVTKIDLKDFQLPLFDQDLESAQGPPENATRLKQIFVEHQALLIASPEYNSSITPLLKNTIDWVSRPEDGVPMLAGFHGKVAALMSASPGALGGLRGLVHVRSILSSIGVTVLPDQVAISRAGEAFNSQFGLRDEKQHQRTVALGTRLAEIVAKLYA